MRRFSIRFAGTKVKKKNIILSKALLIALLFIWGDIIYQVIISTQITADLTLDSMQSDVKYKEDKVETYIYNADVRDPFIYFIPVKKDSTKKNIIPTPKVVWTPPPFKLTGIMMAGSKRTLSIEDNTGAIYFLQQGDTLRGVKILKVTERKVAYSYMKKKDDWILDSGK
jgi:hypothetical protein